MFEKKGQDKQFWRLEDNGCLRNKAHDEKCLGLDRNTVGGIPVLEKVFGGLDNSQRWKYKEIIFSEYGYIVNKFRSSILPDNLSLDIIWADVPLITDRVPVNVGKQDGTQSMKWKFVEP